MSAMLRGALVWVALIVGSWLFVGTVGFGAWKTARFLLDGWGHITGLRGLIVAGLLLIGWLLWACNRGNLWPGHSDYMAPWADREPGDLGGKGARR